MTFGNLLSVELAASIVGAFIAALLLDGMHASPYWLVPFVPVLILAILYASLKHRVWVMGSGVVAYYRTFPVSEGPHYWTSAQKEFVYWGVTAGSILEELRSTLSREVDTGRHYRLLLLSADGRGMREQVAFKKGYDFLSMSQAEREAVEEECKVEQQRLLATITVVKSLPPYAIVPRRLEIRVFDEFLPSWMYMIDQQTVLLGILQFGQQVGDQPTAVLKRHPSHHNLFTTMHENLERVWRGAKPV